MIQHYRAVAKIVDALTLADDKIIDAALDLLDRIYYKLTEDERTTINTESEICDIS